MILGSASDDAGAGIDCGRLSTALARATLPQCRRTGGPLGTGEVKLTIEPGGTCSVVVLLNGPFDGTDVEACIVAELRGLRTAPFLGSSIDVVAHVSVE